MPIVPGNLIAEMDKDHYDIIMSDIFLSGRYAEELELSKPYLDVSLALLTRKENKMFDNFDVTTKLDTFTISYIDRKEIAKDFLSFFPEGGSYPVREIGDYFDYNENILKEKYGLKNKREIWKADAAIGRIRNLAKELITKPEEEKELFIKRLQKKGFSVESIADSLALDKENWLK